MLCHRCSLHHDDNGTFLCQGENEHGSDIAVIDNLVYDKPEVKVDYVRAVAKDKLFLNWTITDWNSPVTGYFLSVSSLLLDTRCFDALPDRHMLVLQYRESGESSWVYFITEKIPMEATSFVMTGLKPDTEYHIKLAAKNKY